MISYETLKSFCGSEPLRPVLSYAVKRNGYWWASDGHGIICVPMKETQQGDIRFLMDEIPEDMKYPNTEAVIDVKKFKRKFTVKVTDIQEAMGKVPLVDEYREVEREIRFIECPKCGGRGVIELDDTIYYKGRPYDICAETDCPICHGYGKIPDMRDYDPDEDDYDPEDEKYCGYEMTGRKIPDEEALLRIIGCIKVRFVNLLLKVAREQGVEDIECAVGEYRDINMFRMHGVIVGIMPMLGTKGFKGTLIDVKHGR